MTLSPLEQSLATQGGSIEKPGEGGDLGILGDLRWDGWDSCRRSACNSELVAETQEGNLARRGTSLCPRLEVEALCQEVWQCPGGCCFVWLDQMQSPVCDVSLSLLSPRPGWAKVSVKGDEELVIKTHDGMGLYLPQP